MKISSIVQTRHPRMAVGIITDRDHAGLIRVATNATNGIWMRETDVLAVIEE